MIIREYKEIIAELCSEYREARRHIPVTTRIEKSALLQAEALLEKSEISIFDFTQQTIELFMEYRDKHGCSEEDAKREASLDSVECFILEEQHKK